MKLKSRTVIHAVKGLDRIALVVAIIAAMPGFCFGYLWNQDRSKIETSEYKAWRANEYDFMKRRYSNTEEARKGRWQHEFRDLATVGPPKPVRWDYPSPWISAMWGLLVFTPLSFLVSYFLTPAAIRLGRRLVLWVIEVI